MNTGDMLSRYRKNLQGEIDSAALYRAMSSAERSPQVAELYMRLAAVEEKPDDLFFISTGCIVERRDLVYIIGIKSQIQSEPDRFGSPGVRCLVDH